MARSVGAPARAAWMAAVTSSASGATALTPDDPVSPWVATTTGVPRPYAASRAPATVAVPVQRSSSGAAGTYRSTRRQVEIGDRVAAIERHRRLHTAAPSSRTTGNPA